MGCLDTPLMAEVALAACDLSQEPVLYTRPELEQAVREAATQGAMQAATRPAEVVEQAAIRRAQVVLLARLLYSGLVTDANAPALLLAAGLSPAEFRLALGRLGRGEEQEPEESPVLGPLEPLPVDTREIAL
jgi:hypothetical protein